MNNAMEKEIFNIYLDDIIPNRFQPRLVFEEQPLRELAESIKLHGIIQPLVLRKIGDKYEIIAGERRYKASQMAGLDKVPAIIMNLDDKSSAEVAILENTQRMDLTPIEEAKSYKKLLEKGYLTQDQLASRMGKTQSTISNKLRLLNLDDEVQEALLKNRISERHARSLLVFDQPIDQVNMLHEILEKKMNVRDLDNAIKVKLGRNVENSEPEQREYTSSEVMPEIKNEAPVVQSMPLPSVEALPVNPVIEKPQEIPESFSSIFSPELKTDINTIKTSAVDINNEPVKPADINTMTEVKKEDPFVAPIMNNNPKPKFFMNFEEEEIKPTVDLNNLNTVFTNFDQVIQPTVPVEPAVQKDFGQFNPSKNVSEASDIVRQTVSSIQAKGFKVITEEYDFEKTYQIVIKIEKE